MAVSAPRLPSRLLNAASDERLVAHVRTGSHPAFEVVFERHHRAVLAFCRHMVGSPEEAEDAVQHTFMAAYRGIREDDRAIALRPWLFTIARNRCLDILRARRERPLEEAPEPSTEHLSAEVQRREDLRTMLGDVARLPDDQRAALVLAEVGAASHADADADRDARPWCAGGRGSLGFLYDFVSYRRGRDRQMARQPRSLTGTVAVVTGGGRGIGRAIATALVRKGVRVAIGDVDLEAAERTAAELGDAAVGLRLDVTDLPGYTAFLDDVERRLGPIDVLVNNAGIMPVTSFEDESGASISRQLEINLRAVIHGTQEAARRMRPRGAGHIVNIASLAGKGGYPHLATYSATKHGVVGLSEAVRLELRGSGVEVSVVMPGIVNTELTTGMQEARGIKNLRPEQVADEIVRALERPRFDVFVPRYTGALFKFAAVLPRRARETMAHLMRADQVAVSADQGKRTAYESRAAASAPAAEKLAEVRRQPAEERSAA